LGADTLIAAQRNRVNADVVVGMILTNDPYAAGLGWITASEQNAFAVVESGY
jgi:hypothetical protein